MKKLFTLIIALACFQSAFAQLNFLPKFIRKMYFNKDTNSRKPSFLVVPALSSSPETGLEFGGAAILSFYSDTIHRDTRVSSLFGYATITTKGQAKLSLNTSYWTPQNKWHYTSSVSYYNYPFDFYGIGNNTKLSAVDPVEERRYKFSIGGERLFGDRFYIGYVAGAVKYYYKYQPDPNATINLPDVEDRHGGDIIYAGPSFTYDTRNNNTYTTRGMIISTYYNLMQGIYYNSFYQGGFFNIEYSQFFLLAAPLVLGLDVQEQSLTGGQSPFYLMPQMGSDEMMRGYYQGRYRDRNFIAGQTELRYRIDKRWGLAAFAGTGEVFHTTFSTEQLKPNYGGGVRYFFDVQKGLAIRLDYGVGQKPAGEPRESGFYIALGQSF